VSAVSQLARKIVDSRFLRFAVIGSGGFIVDESVLALLHGGIGLDPFSARAISILTAMTFTWWGNRNLTFREHAASGAQDTLSEWLRFMAANTVGALVNYGTYAALVRFAPAPLDNAYLAVAAGVAVGLVFNFTLSKRFVFRAGD
jgi:dolichol-phosphate mannosyltransferase